MGRWEIFMTTTCSAAMKRFGEKTKQKPKAFGLSTAHGSLRQKEKAAVTFSKMLQGLVEFCKDYSGK
jgi:hypothetical protein